MPTIWPCEQLHWNGLRFVATRIEVNNIRGINNPEFANRLNGNFFLNVGTTVGHDDDVDTISGDTGLTGSSPPN